MIDRILNICGNNEGFSFTRRILNIDNDYWNSITKCRLFKIDQKESTHARCMFCGHVIFVAHGAGVCEKCHLVSDINLSSLLQYMIDVKYLIEFIAKNTQSTLRKLGKCGHSYIFTGSKIVYETTIYLCLYGDLTDINAAIEYNSASYLIFTLAKTGASKEIILSDVISLNDDRLSFNLREFERLSSPINFVSTAKTPKRPRNKEAEIWIKRYYKIQHSSSSTSATDQKMTAKQIIAYLCQTYHLSQYAATQLNSNHAPN